MENQTKGFKNIASRVSSSIRRPGTKKVMGVCSFFFTVIVGLTFNPIFYDECEMPDSMKKNLK